jgi:hypothetical protein
MLLDMEFFERAHLLARGKASIAARFDIISTCLFLNVLVTVSQESPESTVSRRSNDRAAHVIKRVRVRFALEWLSTFRM